MSKEPITKEELLKLIVETVERLDRPKAPRMPKLRLIKGKGNFYALVLDKEIG